MMVEKTQHPEYLASRIHWLMLSRVIIVTFLLALATFIEIKEMESLSAISASMLFKIILLTYILSIFFLFLLKHIQSISLNIYMQSLCDIALVTTMMYATGGSRSIYSAFYPLIIIYSVIFLRKRGGFVIASTASIFYGLFAIFEFIGVIYPLFSSPVPDYQLNAGDVFARIFTHILSFYLIAFLASFVVEQERKTRTLLAEKQSAFDQLDLLHRSIIESVDTGILTVNLAGQIKSFNRAASEITGLSFHNIENHKYSEIFPGDPSVSDKQNSADSRSRNPLLTKTHFEMLYSTVDGKRLALSCSVSPLRDPQGVTIGSIVIFQDATAITEMKESLEKSRRLAFIGEMAASLAHEIRNPLASISGSIQMLEGDPAQNETNTRLMRIIRRGKDQLENFLRDFLLMARPATGIREEHDVRETIKDIIDSLRLVVDWHEQIDVIMVLTDDPIYIRANKTEIRQVIWNLILNALQAMPEGGVLRVDSRPMSINERAGAEISIGDTGCGIREQDISKIFDPFYTTRDTGTGLGLAVVSRIIEAYGGKINLQSEPGKGTVFTVWFPTNERELSI